MSIEQLEELCSQSREIVAQTAAFIRAELGKVDQGQIEVKDLNSLVSYVDKRAEEQLAHGLSALLPGAGFLTEEETVAQGEAVHRWIIDPLDGTTNFLHQLPFFSISVALQFEGELVMGIVMEVVREECFYAWKGGGAWLNGQPISVSQNTQLSEALLATGFPYTDFEGMEAYVGLLKELMRSSRGIRRLGSAALDLAFTACGRFDSFYEYGLNAWDVAAGIVIVQEAGGVVSDFSGGGDALFGRTLISGSPAIHGEMLGLVKKYFGN
ncbi:MAG: inositol monophosphatase family protein [Bacteroidota bacterium]